MVFSDYRQFGLYRWHIHDLVRFEKEIRITVQALDWRGDKYLPLQVGISSKAFWHQTESHSRFPDFPDRLMLEVN
jgi:hypothetical protein